MNDKYIDASGWGGTQVGRKYPWDKWANLPPGKGLLIEDERPAQLVLHSLRANSKGHQLGLRFSLQKGRPYVYRPEKATP